MKNYMATGRKNQYILVVVFILTGLIFYFFGIRENSLGKARITLYNVNENLALPGFIVHTPGCRIPEMDPFDVAIRKYLRNPGSAICNKRKPLIESNQTSIWIVEKALGGYNATNSSELICCYSSFWRRKLTKGIINKNADNLVTMGKNCITFNNSAEIHSEFIQVKCKLNGMYVYNDYHAFIVPKSKNESATSNKDLEVVSVLILGADSMSRLNFYRQMPITRDLIHSLGAIEFFGYNKVHDNTFPNLVPMLSGLSVKEISTNCWINNSFFDDCPWIWKNFSANNYLTAFGEDACWIGLFNYLKKGFLRPPTDYYVRPYMQTNEKRIGHYKLGNTQYCVGTRLAAEVLLNYAYKFTVNKTLSNEKFWAFFWESSLTHDFLNVDPSADVLFSNLIKKLQNENVLKNTVLIFMSDHGMRWGPIRETYQGRMEEHLPFLYIFFPEWFKRKYKEAVANVEQNTHLLTTHYDIHETLKDLMNLDNINEKNLRLRTLEANNSRGISLFLPISIYRTCKSAGIAPTWCTCQRSEVISKEDENVRRAANVIVEFLNKILIEQKECAQLELYEIMSARIELAEGVIHNKARNKFSDYIVTIVTTPGLAKFEAIVRHRSGKDDMEVLGEISRINVYGLQSRCVSNYRLKLYCYCI